MARLESPIRVSHIVFDVDGTLVDFDAALRESLRAAAAHASEVLGTLVTPQHLQRAREQTAADLGARGLPLATLRRESLRRVLEAGGLDGDARDAATSAVTRTFFEVRDRVLQPYEDVEPALAALHARGFTLLTASNGNAMLETQPFRRYLAHVHMAEHDGISKPDPRFFRNALAHVDGRPERALGVGDRIDNDYEPARAAGMQAILLDREGTVDDPSILRIESLGDLVPLVEPA